MLSISLPLLSIESTGGGKGGEMGLRSDFNGMNGSSFGYKTTGSVRYIEIAVGILREKPDQEKTNALRVWAVNVVSSYSPIPLSPDAIKELKQNPLPKGYGTGGFGEGPFGR
jgi:hypothetical protein